MNSTEARILDLRYVLPDDVQLSGLSSPQSDGVNPFRTLTGQETVLSFRAPQAEFFSYRSQIYSPTAQVRATTRLNGKVIDTATFLPNSFNNRNISGFFQPGLNRVAVRLECMTASCSVPSLRQYWTQLSLVPTRAPSTTVAPGVERWWLDAPDSRLTVSGSGPLQYDNVNFLRYLTGDTFKLTWPVGTRVLDASLQVAADQPFRVRFFADDTLVGEGEGNAQRTVAPTLSLIRYPGVTAVTAKVQCLTKPDTACARVYFARVSAIPATIAQGPHVPELALTTTLIVLLLLLSWTLLRPAPHQAS